MVYRQVGQPEMMKLSIPATIISGFVSLGHIRHLMEITCVNHHHVYPLILDIASLLIGCPVPGYRVSMFFDEKRG